MSIHRTVLLKETIDGLNLPTLAGRKPRSVIVDGTFGGGGHSVEVCERCPTAQILAFDQDENALKKKDAFKKCDISFVNENFRNIDKVLDKMEVKEVDGIILDLGLSSDQLENSGRGFSFKKNEPLLMTMKANPNANDITAKDAINSWSEKSLADIIYGFGEERFAKRIAKAIVEAREQGEINTTEKLVKVIEGAVPKAYKSKRIHFATKTFQAIRMAVNDELEALKEGLEKGFKFLSRGGRMSVISFHSLEDRIVKQFFRKVAANGEARLINKKVIVAGEEELKDNPRARSAKLRILEKIK